MNPKRDKTDWQKDGKAYVYYTGLGFQMIATIGVFAFIGYKVDMAKAGEVGIYTGLLSLLGVCISLYYTIRSVLKRK
ncbi:AtpZ/AtpI family protein [Olivibacter sp. XZL3]|uniref:AtpZ/AtpI family protein n=1 Tax=Olivibacter sp. XZL3 TaxID=1735116 RepID=UPI00106710D5|nr:AtpZ/AtpI family protein [Olivibacter sp. XZL3]